MPDQIIGATFLSAGIDTMNARFVLLSAASVVAEIFFTLRDEPRDSLIVLQLNKHGQVKV